MENKIAVILSIIAIVCGLTSLIISIHSIMQDDPGEIKEPEPLIKEYPMVKEYPKACYMPRDCFDSEKDYLDQFPGREIPEILYECLVYCYN